MTLNELEHTWSFAYFPISFWSFHSSFLKTLSSIQNITHFAEIHIETISSLGLLLIFQISLR